MSTIVVGLSGGVDSSVAAALLREAGHDVVGVTLRTAPWDEPERPGQPIRILLLGRDGGGRAAGGAAARDPLLPPQPRARVRRARDRRLHARVRRGPHAEPLRRLQPRGQVRHAAPARARVGRGGGRDRPLRPRRPGPAHGPRCCSSRRATPAKDQSYFLWPLTPGAARPGALSGRRARRSPRSARAPARSGSRRRPRRRARSSAS